MQEQQIKTKCPNCKSKNIWKSGFAITRNGKVQLYQCKRCGRKFREEIRIEKRE